MHLHVPAEGGIDAALITPAPSFEEFNYVRVEPDCDLFLLAKPQWKQIANRGRW